MTLKENHIKYTRVFISFSPVKSLFFSSSANFDYFYDWHINYWSSFSKLPHLEIDVSLYASTYIMSTYVSCLVRLD